MPIEPACVSDIKVPHELRTICFSGFDENMKVIAHQNIGI
jgi:hypothetical protein